MRCQLTGRGVVTPPAAPVHASPTMPINDRRELLYLDFDGVLHPEDVRVSRKLGCYVHSPAGHLLFEHAQLLGYLLMPYPRVSIILSTTWAQHYGVFRAAQRLPEVLRTRCIGGTMPRYISRRRFAEVPRGHQVLQDVERRAPHVWLAIDDTDEGWSAASRAHLVVSHAVEGIANAVVRQDLTDKLLRFTTADVR